MKNKYYQRNKEKLRKEVRERYNKNKERLRKEPPKNYQNLCEKEIGKKRSEKGIKSS